MTDEEEKLVRGNFNNSSNDERKADFPIMGMENKKFEEAAHHLVKYIISYYDDIKQRKPCADVTPGM